MNDKYLTISAITRYLKNKFDTDVNLRTVYLKGEISNIKYHTTGHLYFSLKDKESTINAVMFNNYAKRVAFSPKNGDEVIVLASVDAYIPRGTYNLNVFEMEEVGLGQQLVELEKLKSQ